MKIKLCTLCRENIAELPDRYILGRPIKRICFDCHRVRLKKDLSKIIKGLNNKDE